MLAIAGCLSICSEGCLKCNDNDECLICDITQGYKLNGSSCENAQQPNCIYVDFEGNCLSCRDTFMIDTETFKCVLIENPTKLPNCAVYLNTGTCRRCENKFYFEEANCVAVDIEIADCEVYLTAKTCALCRSGFLLSANADKCVPSPKLANCQAYTHVTCLQCADGLLSILNGYHSRYLNVSSTQQRFDIALSMVETVYTPIIARTACETSLTPNCNQFKVGFNICEDCAQGYFINSDRKCIRYPDEPILNCLKYASTTECVECINLHYFFNDVCTLIEDAGIIQGCIKYDATLSNISCLECDGNSFLSSNNCLKRENSTNIPNCQTKSLTSDKCQTCIDNYRLTDDLLACKPILVACRTYEPANKTQEFKCTSCEDGFYLKTNDLVANPTAQLRECLAGKIDDCARYMDGAESTCLSCKNGFVLNAGVCEKSNEIVGCTDFHETDKTRCNHCNDEENFNFIILKKCVAIPTPVTNCAKHSGVLNSPICDECETGYSLINNSCNEVTIQNCVEIDQNNKCVSCKKNLAVARNGNSCIPKLAFIGDRCIEDSLVDEANTEKVVEVTCNRCSEHSYPVTMKDGFVCVANTNLPQFHDTHEAVTACIKYNEDIECIQCDPAETRKYLKAGSPPSCVDKCLGAAHGAFEKLKLDVTAGVNADDDTAVIDSYNVCDSAVTNGCFAQGPELTTEPFAKTCLSCLDTHFPVIDLTATTYSNVDFHDTAAYPYVPSMFSKYPTVTCTEIIAGNTIASTASNTANALTTDCEYYKLDSGTDFLCIRCKHGFSGAAADTGHIATCTEDSNCDSLKRLYNLDLIWEGLVSCHGCTNPTDIPFIGYEVTSNSNPVFTKLSEFNSDITGIATFNAGTGSKSVFCAANAKESFGLTTNYIIDAGCAIGVILTNTDGQTNLGGPTYGNLCAACKPGYTGTPLAGHTHFKTACTEINNCNKSGNLANTCGVCSDGYIHEYVTDNIDFTSCLQIPQDLQSKLTNCQAAEKTAGLISTCKVCKKGFFLNKDDYCERYQALNCETDWFMRPATILSTQINWAIYLANGSNGCNKCNSTYSAVKLSTHVKICVNSEWITNSVDGITDLATTNFIPFCASYETDSNSTFVCKECDTGYVIKVDSLTVLTGDQCLVDTEIKNCQYASSATECLQCKDTTYGLIENKCLNGTIPNCKAYNYNSNFTSAQCTECETGFYITSEKKCGIGLISNCATFVSGQASKCETCNEGYTKLSVKDNKDYCYPIDTRLECTEIDADNNANGGELTCLKCTNGSTELIDAPKTDDNHAICMPYVEIDFCLRYDISTNLNNTSFTCLECQPEFYASSETGKCEVRKVSPPKCLSYSLTSDTCTECNNTSYLFNNNTECKDNPSGILSCFIYKDEFTCDKCRSGYYLKENACIKVDPIIDDCLHYTSEIVCAECKPGFIRKNNQCFQTTATGCATFLDIAKCKTCFDLDGLVENEDGTKVNCESKHKLGCKKVDDNEPWPCLECEKGLYADGGDCLTPNIIKNCEFYDGKEICKQCKSGTVLSANRKSCNSTYLVSLIPLNCEEANEVSEPICSQCEPNYYFDNGECVELCTGADKERCFTCDPETPDKCFSCKPGYYQDKEGKCNAIFDDNDGDGESPGDSSSITSVFVILFAFALYW